MCNGLPDKSSLSPNAPSVGITAVDPHIRCCMNETSEKRARSSVVASQASGLSSRVLPRQQLAQWPRDHTMISPVPYPCPHLWILGGAPRSAASPTPRSLVSTWAAQEPRPAKKAWCAFRPIPGVYQVPPVVTAPPLYSCSVAPRPRPTPRRVITVDLLASRVYLTIRLMLSTSASGQHRRCRNAAAHYRCPPDAQRARPGLRRAAAASIATMPGSTVACQDRCLD